MVFFFYLEIFPPKFFFHLKVQEIRKKIFSVFFKKLVVIVP